MLAVPLLNMPAAESGSYVDTAEALKVQKIFHIAGVPGLKRDARGDLMLSATALSFRRHNRDALAVPYTRIRRVAFIDSTREYAKTAYPAVPAFGVAGALIFLQEHHVDALVIDFDNERGGHMLALFQVPKKDGLRCQEWLEHAGVSIGPITPQEVPGRLSR